MLDLKRLILGLIIFTLFPKNISNIPYKHTKSVALTFDDGPHINYTEKIIKILKRHDVKATFFVVGKQVEKYPHLLKLIVESKFEVGSHSYSHTGFRKMKIKDIIDENERVRKLVKYITNKDINLLRPPGGYINPKIKNELEKENWKIVLWDLYPKDIESNKESIINTIFSNVKDKDIILLHSGVDATIDALDTIIIKLKKMGFEFYYASELIKLKDKPFIVAKN
ncbi:MAG: polysaccharide deacetylase family protein [bacterium]|nr:polysaccharide deacetylase family protein [bacterium]